MPDFSKDDQKMYSSLRRIKRRRINEIGSLLKEWYGEERSKSEIVSYFPKVVSVKEVLSKIVSNENYHEIELLGKIQKSWTELVGQEISSNSKPLSLKDGNLTIQAKNNAWLAELKTFYGRIIETKILSAFKNSKLKKIYFVSAGK
ncbi:MAG TPA: hypothetical protein DD381_09105 [Lentisphaeria bacterium]|nr:MAG: hypothetical protein A2X47_07755 [Lentisphaerae bacterium GWF2_38_69]HBM16480.1 hypothetical protein [Lentisphaeria bacterium]